MSASQQHADADRFCIIIDCPNCVIFGTEPISSLSSKGKRIFAEACKDFAKEKKLQRMTSPPPKDWLKAWRAKHAKGKAGEGKSAPCIRQPQPERRAGTVTKFDHEIEKGKRESSTT